LLFIFIFSDATLPLSRLTIYDPHGKFKFEERNIIFEGIVSVTSVILKEGILNGILEVFTFLR
jgi:hypothetical protein